MKAAPVPSRPSLNLRLAVLWLSLAWALAVFTPSPALAQGGAAQQGSREVTRPPELLETVEAEYPEAAIEARVEGPVKLRLTISATGEVSEAQVIESPGYGLGEAAAAAARQFVFRPAEINDEPAPVVLNFTINFELPILPSEFTGQLLDANTGEGLAGAEVTIIYQGEGEFEEPPMATTQTDEQGAFYFGDVPAGPYKVRLRLDAYRDYETTIELVEGKESSATYEVEGRPINYTGQVREAGTRELLPGVGVELTQVTDGVPEDERIQRQLFTDAEGRFGARGLPPGRYRVLLDAQGYKSAIFVETIRPNERLEGRYYLEAQFYDEYTVTTTAQRERRAVNRQTLTLKEARRIPGTGGDVVRVVQNLPGVARAPFGAGLLVVRGSNPQDSAVFLGGDELPIVYHFLAGPAVVNSEMIQSIDFYPGNFSPRYGRAIGGIINLETRSPRSDQAHGFAEIDIQDASALVEVPVGEDFSFALSGRRSYVDQVLRFVIPEGATDVFVAPYYYDYQSWLTYKGLENHKLELFIYGSRDELRVIFDQPIGNNDIQITSLNQETEFHRGQLSWEWRPSQELQNRMMASFGFIQTGLDAGPAFGFTTNLWTVNVRDDLEVKLGEAVSVRAGTDMQFITSNFEIRLPGLGGNDPGGPTNPVPDGIETTRRIDVSYPAFWLEVPVAPVEGLTVTPGLRVDHYSNIGRTTFSPRFTARWAFLDNKLAAKGGIGLFDQPPDPGSTLRDFGNPNLESEKAIHYALGGEWRPLKHIEFDTTAFYRDAYDRVNATSDFTVDEETGEVDLELYNNDGEGRAYGVEFLLRHYPHNRFFGWIAYTLSRSERLDLETGEWELFGFDQTHILTAVAGYNLPYNFDLSARFRLVTGNPYTPVVGSVFDNEEDSYRPIDGEPNSARNATFNQLDIRLDKSFVFDAWMLGVYLDVQNVYWADNPEGILYNYDYTESRPINGLPLFPNLGITAKF